MADTIQLHQANERTMLAWIRTGIALMAFGFAIARFGIFLREVAPNAHTVANARGLGSSYVGAALVISGMLANLVATIRYGRIRAAIERGDFGAPRATLVYLFGALMVVVGLVMSVLLTRTLD